MKSNHLSDDDDEEKAQWIDSNKSIGPRKALIYSSLNDFVSSTVPGGKERRRTGEKKRRRD
jgi:hypothetical protein